MQLSFSSSVENVWLSTFSQRHLMHSLKKGNLFIFYYYFLSQTMGLVISYRRLVLIQWGYWFVSQVLVILSFLKVQPLRASDGPGSPPPLRGECPHSHTASCGFLTRTPPAALGGLFSTRRTGVTSQSTLYMLSHLSKKMALRTDHQPSKSCCIQYQTFD